MKALTEEQYNALANKVPEDAFQKIVPLLMESFASERGRTLDTTQTAALCLGVLEMAQTIDGQIDLIGEMQAEIEELKSEIEKKGKIWTPR